MKNRYRLVRRAYGIYYCLDKQTRKKESLETSDRMAKRLLPLPKAPEILGVPPTRRLESKAPASNRILTASVVSAETKSAPKPVAVPASVSASSTKKSAAQVPVSVSPAASAKTKPAFVWDESQGID